MTRAAAAAAEYSKGRNNAELSAVYLSQHGVGCSPLVGAPARAGGSAAEARAGARILKRMQSTKKKVGVTCVEKKKQA